MDRTPPGSPIWRLLGLLEGVRKQGSGWEARCPGPSHKNADRHPSLSIGTGADGRALLHCQAGCTTEDVLQALGLDYSALFEKTSQGDRVRRFNLYRNGHVVATHVRVDAPDGKRMYWQRNGQNSLGDLGVVDLPLYGAEQLPERPDEVVYLVEGEAAAQALIDLGLLAAATVTGAATIPSDAALAALQGRQVRVWPDNDADGRTHMVAIAARLQASVAWVVWPEAPAGGDAADYVAMGGSVEDLELLVGVTADEPAPAARQGNDKGAYSAMSLVDLDIPQPRWAVPDYWPEGLVLIVGKSKLGKSWLVLDVGVAIASGGLAWGKVQVEQGDVLYLALEDTKRRMQSRLYALCGRRIPERLYIAHSIERADEGGLEYILAWLEEHPEARLVIIDILGRFRPREVNKRRLYDQDYESIAPLAELARARGVCVVVVHHANKLNPEDGVDSVSGTTGLAGAADAIGIFTRERGQHDAMLLMTGRDIEETENALKFTLPQRSGSAWTLLGDAAQHRISRERQAILEIVSRDPGTSPAQVADELRKTRGAVRWLMSMMAREGQLRVTEQGHYYPPFAYHTTPLTPQHRDQNGHQAPNTSTNTQQVGPVSGASTASGAGEASAAGTSWDSSQSEMDLGFAQTPPTPRRLCRWCGRSMPHTPDDVCRFPEDRP